ncbi:MAG: tetratricopeptide repeat protein [Pyrinomonadaceae bacterium]
MFRNFLSKNPLKVRHCIFLLCLTFFISCQNAARTETPDAKTKNELSRINQILTTGQPLTPQDFESIKQIREKYPNSVEVRNVYQSALVKRGDWESIAKLIGEIPATERKREDNLNLAKSYLKLGRYQEEIDLLKPLADANQKDADYNSLLAFGYFYLGQTPEAAKYLDAVWDALVQNKKIDEINTRGMIYFREKNYEKAIETFKKTLEINENDISANNTLSRIFAAQGNSEQAEIYRSKTEKAHESIGANETKASRFVQNSYQLEDAWKAKRYDEVISLARQMLADAGEANKPALYQYMAESYKALGKPDEAQKVLAEAQNSRQK